MTSATIDPSTLRLLRLARAALADARDLIDQGLPGAAKVVLPSALGAGAPLYDDARTRHEHLPTDFPRIGGRDLAPGQTAAFASPWWREVFRPGERRELFFSCCIGQRQISFALRRPCYQIGVDDPGQAWHRTRSMKHRRYGAGCYSDGRYTEDDRNWSEWFLGMMSDRFLPSPGSPVALTERGVIVRLPSTLDPAVFDGLIVEEILKGSLSRWLQTAEGKGHCAMLGVDPALGRRFTSPPVGSNEDPAPVEDIVVCAQRTAQGRLIHIAEQIILGHLREHRPKAA